MRTFAFRLRKGHDIKKEIKQFASQNKIQAGVILTVVGCVDKAVVRMAGATPENFYIKAYQEKLEIVSLTGTVSQDDCHLHISLANKDGKVFGGHLKGEAIVDVTAEVVIGELEGIKFTTELDETTGYHELRVIKK